MSKLTQAEKQALRELSDYTFTDPCADCPFIGRDVIYCHVCPYDK